MTFFWPVLGRYEAIFTVTGFQTPSENEGKASPNPVRCDAFWGPGGPGPSGPGARETFQKPDPGGPARAARETFQKPDPGGPARVARETF